MKDWEKSLDKFLLKYKNCDEVVGAFLCGSYATENYTPNSDIDVYIITADGTTWRERGNIKIDGFLIEYFINPVNKCISYLEKENKEDRRLCTTGMLAFGNILFDKTGAIKKLQNMALKYYDKSFEEYNDFKLQTDLYHCWDFLDELESLYQNKQNIEFTYYILLEQLIEVHYYKNGYSMIPITKVERLYKDEEYCKKYNLRDIPKKEFCDLVLKCIEDKELEKRIKNIKTLYKYTIDDCGGFDINSFKLRSEI